MMIKINPQPIKNKFPGMTQDKMADAIGISKPAMLNWIHGRLRTVDLATLDKMCAATGAQPGDFFIRAEIPAQSSPAGGGTVR